MRLKRYYTILITLALFVLIYFLGKLVPESVIREFVATSGPFAPVVIVLLLLITYVVAPLSGSPVLFVGYYLYGTNVIYLATVTTLISSVINFLIARNLGRKLVEKMAGINGIKRIDKLVENYGLITLFFLRVFEGGISDFVSYSSGLTKIKFKPYIFISTAGIIINTIIWYQFVIRINNPLNFTVLDILLTAAFSGIFITGSWIISKIRK